VIFPIHVSHFFGGIATVALGLLMLTAFYATIQILAQLTEPLHLFLVFRLERAPVVTLVIIIGLLSSLVSTNTSLHDIRPSVAKMADDRPFLSDALASWISEQSSSCSLKTTVSGSGTPVAVQPMLFIAAEGGGVRAAWWTVDVMQSITSTACGRQSIFLASGVSDGAVGLGLTATTKNPYEAMKKVAGPDALSSAIDGMLSRDLVARSFGVNVQAADGPSDNAFPDRADLMEQSWESEAPGLADPFPQQSGSNSAPWYTVFNSTSVANKCRVLISNVKLTTSTVCNGDTNPDSWRLRPIQRAAM
jgi:hypothetical protein